MTVAEGVGRRVGSRGVRGPVGSLPNVTIIDSARNRYVEEPDIERRVLDGRADVELLHVADSAELVGKLDRADAVISWHLVPLDATAIGAMRRCRGIVRAAVGFDNIDLSTAASRGIPVANVPDYGTEEVADHSLALLLSVIRNLPTTDRCATRGTWNWRDIEVVPRLRGLRLGLVGLGRIGSAVARRAQVFGMDVSFFDPYVPSGVDKSLGVARCESLAELLDRVDALSLHVPLTDETRGMIDAAAIRALGPDGFIVNTSRGEVVDEPALVSALESGALVGAGLDVLADEPRIPEVLREHPRVLLTAHSAFYSEESIEELRSKAAESALRFILEVPERNVVNGIKPPLQAG